MAEYTDVANVHLEKILEEGGGSFTLHYDKSTGWTANGTKKHGRKDIIGTGDTATGALADFLAQIRGEPVEADVVAETPEQVEEVAAEPAQPTNPAEDLSDS